MILIIIKLITHRMSARRRRNIAAAVDFAPDDLDGHVAYNVPDVRAVVGFVR